MKESRKIPVSPVQFEELLLRLEMQNQQLKAREEQLLLQENKLAELTAELQKLTEQLQDKDLLLKLKEEEYQALNAKYLQLQRQIFGYRSEKRLPDPDMDMQGWLFAGDLEVECLQVEESVKPIQAELAKREKELADGTAKSKKREGERRPLKLDPSSLEIKEIVHVPEGFDEETHEQIAVRQRDVLQMRPSQLYIERHIFPVVKKKETTYLDDPDMLRASVDTGNASGTKIGNTIFATMMVDKFKHHIPEYRQLKRFKEMGIELSKSTINRGINDISLKLSKLYQVLVEKVLSSSYIQMDESVLRIRDRQGKSRKGYIWAVRAMDFPGVFFHYDKGSRSQETLLSILKDYQGAIQSDGYAAYSQYEQKAGVTPLACMAHVRRKFEQASKEGDKRADDMLKFIALLYTLEAQLKETKAPPDKVRAERMRIAAPLLRAMETWMQHTFEECTPKSTLGKAITYAHTLWIRISRYCTDGRYEIDNNGIERVMRNIAMGRSNYLFVNNDTSAENYARIYSFMVTCEAAGVNFYDWLLEVLPKLSKLDTLSSEDLRQLLPSPPQS